MVLKRRNINFLLHLDAESHLIRKAQYLRKQETMAEKILWDKLKNRKCGDLKFRRQHPIHYYVADFYCHEERLIIEVDGEIHSVLSIKEHDKNRTAELNRYGIRILRFSNEQVINNTQEVVKAIIEFVTNDPYG